MRVSPCRLSFLQYRTGRFAKSQCEMWLGVPNQWELVRNIVFNIRLIAAEDTGMADSDTNPPSYGQDVYKFLGYL